MSRFLSAPAQHHKFLNIISNLGPQVSELDFARAVSELTAEYRAAEAVRWAKRKLSKKRFEAPREPTENEIAEAAAGVPDYPILTVSKKQFYARMCKCTRYLIASMCDCQICSYISVNLRAFHMARGKWDPNGRCERGTCDAKIYACTSDSPNRQASKSPQDMMTFLLCSKCRPFDIQPSGSPQRPPTPISSSTGVLRSRLFILTLSLPLPQLPLVLLLLPTNRFLIPEWPLTKSLLRSLAPPHLPLQASMQPQMCVHSPKFYVPVPTRSPFFLSPEFCWHFTLQRRLSPMQGLPLNFKLLPPLPRQLPAEATPLLLLLFSLVHYSTPLCLGP